MSDLAETLRLVEAGAASLDASRARIDDLNVYPVPDGDTGTNMSLTMRALVEALADAAEAPRPALAHTVTRAALMGARGNSGVILSQIVRGAAEVLGEAEVIESSVVAEALRAASDTAYRGVRQPVEGTILTVIREMAEEAEARAASEPEVDELLRAVLARGEAALARTPELLDVLRDAGVVDAGGAGLVEIVARHRRRGDRRRARASRRDARAQPGGNPPRALGVSVLHGVPRRRVGARRRLARA